MEMIMQRFTPEMVKEAYAKTGLLPHRGSYYFYDSGRPIGACGVGVLAYANGGGIMHGQILGKSLGGDYVCGFIGGFDGSVRHADASGDWHDGYDDGAAAAKAVGLEPAVA
jgi:hypothetical protein